jgi:hypothetical protein
MWDASHPARKSVLRGILFVIAFTGKPLVEAVLREAPDESRKT